MSTSKRGRPTKLTPEVQERILGLIAAGNYLETAAAAAGISKHSLHDWLRWGARGKSALYRNFLHLVEKALAEAEARDVLTIAKASVDQWQAAAWRLERKFPDRWGRKDRVQHSGPDGGPIRTDSKVKHVFDHDAFARLFESVVAGDADGAGGPAEDGS